MDGVDLKVICLLQMDGRASNANIARELGVSEGTVRRRIRRLIHEDVIKITALPSLEKLGYATTALIGQKTQPGKADDVAETLPAFDEVHYVDVTTGAYDVFLWVALGSAESLGTFLYNKIAAIEGMQRTETFVNLAIKKRTYGVSL